MRSDKWQKIMAAKELLQLGDQATLQEIKAAYRRLSKRYHPDRQHENTESGGPGMQEINTAYAVLLDYCAAFSFPLILNDESQPLDDEDWWLARFGEDPLWGKSGKE